MGQFSWIDCKNKERAILDGERVDTFVLVPEEFGETYGLHIKEPCYDGYGHFGEFDAYELVALWNRDHIGIENLIKPERSMWSNDTLGEEFFNKGIEHYERKCERLNDFIKGSSYETMEVKYGKYFLREIGIDIACYDEQNAALEYPLKITHDPDVVYEDCEPSMGDPNQGWGHYCKSANKDIQFMEYWELKNIYENSRDYSECSIIEEYMQDNFEEEYKQDYGSEQDFEEERENI